MAFNPRRPGGRRRRRGAAEADIVLCMSIVPGYSGQAFMPEALGRIAELATLVDVPIQVDGGHRGRERARVRDAGASLLVAGNAVFASPRPAEAYRRLRPWLA